MHQAERMFTKEERMMSNYHGTRGNKKLDPVWVDEIKAATFKLWPLEGKEKLDAWKEGIDEGGRQLNLNLP
jgi:hypothetical protein